MIDTSRALATLQREFPAPCIDPAWVQACAQALADDDQEPSHANIREQFLFSDLAASTLPSNLIPPESHQIELFPRPTLVQILSITEIGHSAFQLQTVHEQRKDVLSGATRIRRIDDGEDGPGEDGLANGSTQARRGDEVGEEDGKLPAYPRGMLKMEVTDGDRVIKALEYRRLAGLKLAETPLGYKNVRALRGTLLLSPDNTRLIGYQVAHLEAEQPTRFNSSLLRRMGKSLPGEDGAVEEEDGNRIQPASTSTVRRGSAAIRAASNRSGQRVTLPPTPQAQSSAGPSRPRSVQPAAPASVASPYFQTRTNQNAQASSSRTAPSRSGRTATSQPHRISQAIRVEEEEDEDDEYDDSFIRQIDAAEAQATGPSGGPPGGTTNGHASSDYGLDDEIDEAMLNELEEVEMRQSQSQQRASGSIAHAAGSGRTGRSVTGTGSNDPTSVSKRRAAAIRAASNDAPAPQKKRRAVVQQTTSYEVDSEDDKENTWPDVIEISD